MRKGGAATARRGGLAHLVRVEAPRAVRRILEL